jgi:uncharacterized membrane protein YqgA involved in biofilm formation
LVRGTGTIVNVLTVLAGTAVGLLAGRRLPERMRTTLLHGLGLVVLVIGISNATQTRNITFPLVCIVLGGLAGEALQIEERLTRLGERLQRLARRSSSSSTFVEAFVTTSLIFCVGPLTILGSIQDGLGRGAQTLIVKAALDGTVALVFASTLGIGVALSALTVLVVQGGLTLAASAANSVLTTRMIDELTATGGIMIIGIGLRLLEIKTVRVASFLPALVLAPIGVALFAR